jgi:hypothetical protein
MRKLHTALVISLLMLLAQQGAVFHELGHISQAGSVAASARTRASVHADIRVEKVCELCLAYSQLANPASHRVQLPQFEPTACAAESHPIPTATPADVPTPRSRGPPASALHG